ncbi:hypothetical protein [Streptomyces hyaluromycini]|uniref:hypothetical protein n=1 Tax=Streptomyces hyaluromycini TaxID=1377993 RepID=UPI000B5CC504|nr:hypothetical protein [Streptomyces hyaluromycini]
MIAHSALGSDDLVRAEAALRTADDTLRFLGGRWGTALAPDALAALAGARGERAVALTEQALALSERLGYDRAAHVLAACGDHLAGTDSGAARAAYTRDADLAAHVGSPDCLAAARHGLGGPRPAGGPDGQGRCTGHRVRALLGLASIAEAGGVRSAARLHYVPRLDARDP